MKKLPVGIQDFAKLIEGDYLYVDKTEYLFELQKGTYYFLSRPRRFGKSLMLSTLKYMFEGRKELFAGLWIEDKISWEKHPVIYLDFSKADTREQSLHDALVQMLDKNAENHGLALTAPTPKTRFGELIEKLSAKGKVVLLIDEYDKPIIDYLDKESMHIAKENRALLKSFYGIIKGSDQYLRFCMLTGVSKFSKVSVFSDLNNLSDISMSAGYAGMLGYTQEELERCFRDRIDLLAPAHGGRDALLSRIKEWYNGYSWDGAASVYNPFSVLRFFEEKAFKNHWFATGTPTFLINLLREQSYDLSGLDGATLSEEDFSQYEVESLQIMPLLFQTGYLTVKKQEGDRYTLGFPNREVAEAFSKRLLDGYSQKESELRGAAFAMRDAIKARDPKEFCRLVSNVFESLKYPIIEKKEAYFHSIFYLIVKLVGFEIEAEVINARGRMDAVVKSGTDIYIMEFKLGISARAAIDQMIRKNYAGAYALDPRPITLIGIAYDAEKRKVSQVSLKRL